MPSIMSVAVSHASGHNYEKTRYTTLPNRREILHWCWLLQMLTDLSEFLRQTIEFHLETVCSLVGGTACIQCVVHVGVHWLKVRLHATLVATQRRHVHRQLVDTSCRVTQLVLGVLTSPLSLQPEPQLSKFSSVQYDTLRSPTSNSKQLSRTC